MPRAQREPSKGIPEDSSLVDPRASRSHGGMLERRDAGRSRSPMSALACAVAGLGALSPWGCGTAPPPLAVTNPTEFLDRLQRTFDQGDIERALETATSVEPDVMPNVLEPRRRRLTGQIQLAAGEPWQAFRVVRSFAQDFPFSEERRAEEDLEFEAGRQLIGKDPSFLGFGDGPRAGRRVLEHLITNHPRNAHQADALRLLGEQAYEEEDWPLALARFKELLQLDRKWFDLARFRIAMSLHRALEGPDYDVEAMKKAQNELRAFLVDSPEQVAMVEEATAAEEQVTRWIASHYLSVAVFYETVDNSTGRARHLELAAGFPETPAGREARRLLDLAAKRERQGNQ